MKKFWLLTLVVTLLYSTALAGDSLYIANPNPTDRLNLRKEASSASKSVGKYYNGAPIVRVGPDENGFASVRVGLDGGYRFGRMDMRYLSSTKPVSAMPQYFVQKGANLPIYDMASLGGYRQTLDGPKLISLMGEIEEGEIWYHWLIHERNGQNRACFVRKRDLNESLFGLPSAEKISVHISNPDKADRLHLRTEPWQQAESMGKYYNGTVGTLLGFSEDGKWLKVELYGRTGWMMRQFTYIEGEDLNPTYYGIPTVQTARASVAVYQDDRLQTKIHTIQVSGQDIEVLGLVNEKVLHVRIHGPESSVTGFIKWSDTNFKD